MEYRPDYVTSHRPPPRRLAKTGLGARFARQRRCADTGTCLDLATFALHTPTIFLQEEAARVMFGMRSRDCRTEAALYWSAVSLIVCEGLPIDKAAEQLGVPGAELQEILDRRQSHRFTGYASNDDDAPPNPALRH